MIFREMLASVQHDIWVHWMKYLFSVCVENQDGSYTIPVDKVQRWIRQVGTQYSELSEDEKQSDRQQADKILSILNQLEIGEFSVRSQDTEEK